MQIDDIRRLPKGAVVTYFVGEYLQQTTKEWQERKDLLKQLFPHFQLPDISPVGDSRGKGTHRVRGAAEYSAAMQGLVQLECERLHTCLMNVAGATELTSINAYKFRRL